MPFFRRRSSASKIDEHNPQETPTSDSKPSLVTRLSRRNSRLKREDVQLESHGGQHSPYPEVPASTPAITQRSSSQTSRESTPAYLRPLQVAAQTSSERGLAGGGLSKDDAKALFSGAPQFMLERGKHGTAFPQAFFPWDKELEISDLQDRKYLKHESFALATLHAHLPIPDDLNWKPSSLGPQKSGEVWKRPMFDLGIFEVPNMLNIDGRIPGTVGLRYFLELPLAENQRTSAKSKADEHEKSIEQSSRIPAFEAFKSLNHGQGYAKIGKHAPPQDRMQLIREGPPGWRRVGVRNITTSNVIERLSLISSWHDVVLDEGFFETFLFPPERSEENSDPEGLKLQIEALVKVLTTPGAWIDFSLVEWRIRLGQVLWELSPHQGHESIEPDCPPGSERAWLLVQLLLAIELVVRLDAALRLGFAHKTEHFRLSGDEIHHFNKLRNTKVNWDLVVARRFLDTLDVRKSSINLIPESSGHGVGLPSFRHKHEESILVDNTSTWECAILPRQPKLQLEGLMRFARLINWPSADRIGDQLDLTLFKSKRTLEELYATPIPNALENNGKSIRDEAGLSHALSGAEWVAQARVLLQPASIDLPGGWLSRSWLTGLIIPSEAASCYLMACLLENDNEAMAKLGNQALLHGGFVLNGRSWWNGWLEIIVRPVSNPRDGLRIHDGVKLAQESSPLGMGHGKVMSNEFEMITDAILNEVKPSTLKICSVSVIKDQKNGEKLSMHTASAIFEIQSTDTGESQNCKVSLLHDVYFVAAYACRLPHGHAVFPEDAGQHHPQRKHAEYLPAHPLHKSYRYTVKGVLDLLDTPPPNPSRDDSEVWILEARDQFAKDIYARAWCAQVGVNALIAMSGKTCLSCAVREAKGLQLGLIIRVGSSSSS